MIGLTIVLNGVECSNSEGGITEFEYFTLKVINAFVSVKDLSREVPIFLSEAP